MQLSPVKLRLLTTSLLTVSFLGALDHTVVSTSLATISGELGALQLMSWVVVGYTLASTVLLPVLGRLGDVLGARRIFLVSLVMFLAASLACGFATDIAWLIAARVLQGMSSAGLQLMSQTIIARVTTQRERPRYMAIIGAAFPIAILVGPVVGGAITDYWGWQWVFWINIPVGAAAFALALVAVPHLEPGPAPRHFDIAGSAVFTSALVALVLAASWAAERDGGPAAGSALAASIAGFIAFFLIERRAPEPIVPLHFFANRTIAAGAALSAIIGVGFFSITAYLPTYFQMAYRTTATVSGLVPIATVFGMLISNLLTGWLASRTGRYRIFPVGGTVLGAGALLMMALLPAGLPLWAPMIVMGAVGLGTGAFMSLIVAVVQGAVPAGQTGTITATINLVRQVGSTVATAVIGGVIGSGVAAFLPAGLDASTLTPQQVHQAPPAVQADVAQIYSSVFTPIFIALACAYALGILAAVLLPHGRLSDEPVPAAHAPSETLPA
ncbi:MFS transporter [Pseudarthrobacter sp. NIBRBAC000502770]|uniref:MFS transporter n=1 Tax=Pseudarthrobacter sp. NIBRBAC000502770 TaxID=2590785 RepID=UPI00113FD886|nr:MFS transporter [Pseudarthrobacter sp. NIBRBAC000502770]QDG90299.1 MFS transporter [Pseudarthrobacter sp. NIBRBAC000502770]